MIQRGIRESLADLASLRQMVAGIPAEVARNVAKALQEQGVALGKESAQLPRPGAARQLADTYPPETPVARGQPGSGTGPRRESIPQAPSWTGEAMPPNDAARGQPMQKLAFKGEPLRQLNLKHPFNVAAFVHLRYVRMKSSTVVISSFRSSDVSCMIVGC